MRLASLSLALALALTGCATTDLGVPVPGSYPSGAPQSTSPQGQAQLIAGQVQQADGQNGRFALLADNGQRVDFRFDQNTQAIYNGQQVNPAGIEQGDRVRIQAVPMQQGLWYARQIEVTQDVRSTGAYPGNTGTSPGSMGGSTGGAIVQVDAGARILTYTRGGYAGVQERVRYDGNTLVEWQGRNVGISTLQRGDTVRITTRGIYDGLPVADRIILDVPANAR